LCCAQSGAAALDTIKLHEVIHAHNHRPLARREATGGTAFLGVAPVSYDGKNCPITAHRRNRPSHRGTGPERSQLRRGQRLSASARDHQQRAVTQMGWFGWLSPPGEPAVAKTCVRALEGECRSGACGAGNRPLENINSLVASGGRASALARSRELVW